MFNQKRQNPRSMEQRARRIQELSETIDNATQERLNLWRTMPAGSLLDKEVQPPQMPPTMAGQLEQLSQVEREAKRELVALFSGLFWDLQMTREWSAVTLALDILRRSDEEVQRRR